MNAGSPVQHMHADAGFANRHKVATEGALGFHLHWDCASRIKGVVRQTLNVVATDDFGTVSLYEINEGLVTVGREFTLQVYLHKHGVTTVTDGAEPNLA